MKSLIIVAASFGGILLFLLASASANTALFARHYPWLLGLNAIVALSLLALIAWQVHVLWLEHRAKVFGSRLKLRLMLMFGLMAVLPGVLSMRFRSSSSPRASKPGSTFASKRRSNRVSTSGAARSIRCSTILPTRGSHGARTRRA
jgi:hypothetical protein